MSFQIDLQKFLPFQIEDPYRTPKKVWQFCHFLPSNAQDEENHVMLQSCLNMLRILQKSRSSSSPTLTEPLASVASMASAAASAKTRMNFRIKVKAVVDEDVVQKVSNFYSTTP